MRGLDGLEGVGKPARVGAYEHREGGRLGARRVLLVFLHLVRASKGAGFDVPV